MVSNTWEPITGYSLQLKHSEQWHASLEMLCQTSAVRNEGQIGLKTLRTPCWFSEEKLGWTTLLGFRLKTRNEIQTPVCAHSDKQEATTEIPWTFLLLLHTKCPSWMTARSWKNIGRQLQRAQKEKARLCELQGSKTDPEDVQRWPAAGPDWATRGKTE